MKKTLKLLILFMLASAVFCGCEALQGQNGADAPAGIEGPEGPQGLPGATGELGFPCDKCVERGNIADDAVAAGKLAPGSVDADALCSNAVGSDALKDMAIGTTQIADFAVTEDLIEDGAVVAGKVAAGGVIAGKLAPNAVEYGDIADGVIGGDQLVTGAANQMWVIPLSGNAVCNPLLPIREWPIQASGAKGGFYLIFFETTVSDTAGNYISFTLDYQDGSLDTLTNHNDWMVTGTPWKYTVQLMWAGELYPTAANSIQARCSGLNPGAVMTNPVLTVIEFSTANGTYLP